MRSSNTKLIIISPPPATLSLSGTNIFLSTVFSNTPSLCPALNVRDQVSHPHKTTSTTIVLHIFNFIFLDNKPEDIRLWTKWYQAFPLSSPALNLFMKAMLICKVCSKIFKLCHTFKGFITYLNTVILSCILFIRHEHILSILSIYFWTNLLTVTNTTSTFSFIVCMPSPNKLTHQYRTEASVSHSNSCLLVCLNLPMS